MGLQVRELRRSDLADLERFLRSRPGASASSGFAAEDVLLWKYFDPRGGPEMPRGFLVQSEGETVAFCGICPGSFHTAGRLEFEVPTIHGVDYLSSGRHAAAGALLLLRCRRYSKTAYALGSTEFAERMMAAAKFRKMSSVPVFTRVLLPSHRLRLQGVGKFRASLLAVRDVARLLGHQSRSSASTLELRKVERFGPEIDEVLAGCTMPVTFTRRGPDLLNHYLRCPRSIFSAWYLLDRGRVRGFAILTCTNGVHGRLGKIVDCFLDNSNPDDWQAAMQLAIQQLAGEGAEVVQACGSTPWAARALQSAGCRETRSLPFWLKDDEGRIPLDRPFHLSFLEADLAYV